MLNSNDNSHFGNNTISLPKKNNLNDIQTKQTEGEDIIKNSHI